MQMLSIIAQVDHVKVPVIAQIAEAFGFGAPLFKGYSFFATGENPIGFRTQFTQGSSNRVDLAQIRNRQGSGIITEPAAVILAISYKTVHDLLQGNQDVLIGIFA